MSFFGCGLKDFFIEVEINCPPLELFRFQSFMVVEKFPCIGSAFEMFWSNVFQNSVVFRILLPVGRLKPWLGFDQEGMKPCAGFFSRFCHFWLLQYQYFWSLAVANSRVALVCSKIIR